MIEVMTQPGRYPVLLLTPAGDVPLTAEEARMIAEQLFMAVTKAKIDEVMASLA